jgi:hypothetical protein
MALIWRGTSTELAPRPRIDLPIAHWTIDCPAQDERQPREHAVTCVCRRARTFNASGLCPSCRAKITL